MLYSALVHYSTAVKQTWKAKPVLLFDSFLLSVYGWMPAKILSVCQAMLSQERPTQGTDTLSRAMNVKTHTVM